MHILFRRWKPAALLSAALIGPFVPGVAGGASVLADLEDQDTTSSGGLTSLSVADAELPDDVTFQITRPGGAFDVVDVSSGSGTIAFGSRSLSPAGTEGSPFVIDFSEAVTSFSLQLGDFGDDTDELSLRAFSGPGGSGDLLDSDSATLVAIGNQFSFVTLEVEGSSIGSVEVMGGPDGTNSVLYDNFAATTAGDVNVIPLPAAAYAFPLGAALVVTASRRLRRQAR